MAILTAAPISVAGDVKCLGWCRKWFHSPDRTTIRFCKACTIIKDRAERGLPRIRKFGDKLDYSFGE